MAGFRAATQSHFNSTVPKYGSDRIGGERFRLSGIVEVTDALADEGLWRVTVPIHILVTTGDHALKVGSEDKSRILQLPGIATLFTKVNIAPG